MLDIASNGPLGVVKNDGICDIAVNIITFLLCYLLHITNLKKKVIIDFEIFCNEGCLRGQLWKGNDMYFILSTFNSTV